MSARLLGAAVLAATALVIPASTVATQTHVAALVAPTVTPNAPDVLSAVRAGDGGAQFVPYAVADRGAALASYLNSHGAHVPAGWAHNADTMWAGLICQEFARNYADWPAGSVDENGVTVPLARAAVSATGFCS